MKKPEENNKDRLDENQTNSTKHKTHKKKRILLYIFLCVALIVSAVFVINEYLLQVKKQKIIESIENFEFDEASILVNELSDSEINRVKDDVVNHLVIKANDAFYSSDYEVLYQIKAVYTIHGLWVTDWRSDVMTQITIIKEINKTMHQGPVACANKNISDLVEFTSDITTTLQSIFDYYSNRNAYTFRDAYDRYLRLTDYTFDDCDQGFNYSTWKRNLTQAIYDGLSKFSVDNLLKQKQLILDYLKQLSDYQKSITLIMKNAQDKQMSVDQVFLRYKIKIQELKK